MKINHSMASYSIYILLCENGSYYTGYARDLAARYASHLNGTASKYTRSFKPIQIAQSWKIEGDRGLAMKIEAYVKQLSRDEKEKIIADPELLFTWFYSRIKANK